MLNFFSLSNLLAFYDSRVNYIGQLGEESSLTQGISLNKDMDKQVESSLKEIMNTARDNVIRRGKKSYQRE